MTRKNVSPWVELDDGYVGMTRSLAIHFNVIEKLFRVLNFHGYPKISFVSENHIDLATHKMLRCRLVNGDDITLWKLTNAGNSVKLVLNNTEGITKCTMKVNVK